MTRAEKLFVLIAFCVAFGSIVIGILTTKSEPPLEYPLEVRGAGWNTCKPGYYLTGKMTCKRPPGPLVTHAPKRAEVKIYTLPNLNYTYVAIKTVNMSACVENSIVRFRNGEFVCTGAHQ